jgi:hypothetical protein
MNKDIKNLISEAFEELYQEIINEAPEVLKVRGIRDNDVPELIKKALDRGTPIPYDFEGGDMKSKRNFDKIINILIDEYKKSNNQNAKKAIQSSMYPYPGSEIKNTIGGQKFYGNKDLDDAVASAYEQVVLKSFDKILNMYKDGTNLGAIFVQDMKNKVFNYMKGYRGDGGSALDVIGGSEKALSLDKPVGDSGESTFGDKIASTMGVNPETAAEKEFSQEKKIAKQKQIIETVTQWLDNKFDEDKNEMGKRRMAAFKGLMAGDSPEDIVNDYPEYFKEPRLVTQEFSRLVNSSEAQEISDIISHIYGINFNLANIDPKKLKQTSSMKPEFGGFSKMIRQATPEMEAAQSELSDALAVVGLKLPQFSSSKNKEQVISNLEAKGMKNELDAILSADEELNRVTEKAKAQGKYQQFEPVLPSSPEEEEKSGEMFEGFNINKLMERVYKRIMK